MTEPYTPTEVGLNEDALAEILDERGLDRADGVNVVSVSGGKDSTATYLAAIESGEPFQAVFADTGHELQPTLDYVRSLSERTGGPPIQWVQADLSWKFPQRRENIRNKWPKEGVDDWIIEQALEVMHPTGNPFLDTCLLRNGFPSSQRQFCTESLKIVPMTEGVSFPIWADGKWVLSWQGIRREESIARSRKPMYSVADFRRMFLKSQWENFGTSVIYAPLLHWTLDDVWAMHERHGVSRNPLYDQGASRVGCGPCIFARKAEIKLIAERYPETVDKIREWERIVGLATKSKPSMATFFTMRGHVPKDGFPGPDIPFNPQKHGIDGKVMWANTSRGGRQYPLFPDEVEVFGSCSVIGMCE